MASLADSLSSLLPLSAVTAAELGTVRSELPSDTLAWAVFQLVLASRESTVDLEADVIRRAKQLAECTNHDRLLVAWTRLMREAIGLAPLDKTLIERMVEANALSLHNVDGFRAVASRFVEPSPRLTTEIMRAPPVRRVATPPTPALELALQ